MDTKKLSTSIAAAVARQPCIQTSVSTTPTTSSVSVATQRIPLHLQQMTPYAVFLCVQCKDAAVMINMFTWPVTTVTVCFA